MSLSDDFEAIVGLLCNFGYVLEYGYANRDIIQHRGNLKVTTSPPEDHVAIMIVGSLR